MRRYLRHREEVHLWKWFEADSFHLPNFKWAVPSYGGPLEPLLGFCTLLIWDLYAYRERGHSLTIVRVSR
jgi:hypothetical protein